jgi:FkbM family methyltransferase
MRGIKSIVGTAKALIAKLAPRPRLHQKVAVGPLKGTMFVLPSGWEAHYTRGVYEPDVTAALSRLVSPGDTCVDAGAHYGYFTLLLARLCGPEGRVYSFEAQVDNARILRENVRANDLLSRVTVEQAAVSARDGSVELHAVASGSSAEWTLSEPFAQRPARPGASGRADRVPAVRLDERLASEPRVDLIKMDIEGAEAEVLPALGGFLERRRPVILLEFHREVGWPAIEALYECGYELEGLDGAALDRLRNSDEVPYQLVARPPRDPACGSS